MSDVTDWEVMSTGREGEDRDGDNGDGVDVKPRRVISRTWC